MSSVPDKYQPEPKRYEQKDWLYQQYWGALKSQNEIAEMIAQSRKKIRIELDKHGIPTRGEGWNNPKANPFAGFYKPHERAPAPANTQQSYQDTPLSEDGYHQDWYLPMWLVEDGDPRRLEDRKEWLYQQYWGELNSTVEIADKAKVNRATIRKRMEQFGIPRRPSGYTDPIAHYKQ